MHGVQGLRLVAENQARYMTQPSSKFRTMLHRAINCGLSMFVRPNSQGMLNFGRFQATYGAQSLLSCEDLHGVSINRRMSCKLAFNSNL